jgi:hypothetical protein
MSLQRDFHAERCALRHAIDRCYNDKHPHYGNYGGRGIRVSEEWRDPVRGFPRFFIHIGPRPSPDHSLDRINNDGNYETGNVRWATRSEQQNNRRPKPKVDLRDYGWGAAKPKTVAKRGGHSPLLNLDGKCQTVVDWAKELDLKAATIRQRIDRGWPMEKVLDGRLYNPAGGIRGDQ